jgi:glutamate-1-semialdehyde 2,1-aminomutase
MDDVRAGFRFDLGGSCEHFGAAPDLICYSKAIANGHALSAALAREPLRGAAERLYFTGSFFFASGAFAAALTTLDVLAGTDAIAHIRRIGELLTEGLAEQARRHGVPLLPTGQPPMPVIRFADDPERRRIRRWCSLVTAGGAYAHPAHNWFVSAAHTTADVTRTLEATEGAFRALAAEGDASGRGRRIVP